MIIAVFGDSIVYGAWDKETGGWVNRLRLSFDEQNHVYHQVYNFGISGDTSYDLLERLGAEARSCEPDVIVISIGINDSCVQIKNQQNRISKEQFKENLKIVFAKAGA